MTAPAVSRQPDSAEHLCDGIDITGDPSLRLKEKYQVMLDIPLEKFEAHR